MHSSCLRRIGAEVTASPPSLQLDIMEPKVPDDIYKTHLENNRKGLRRGLAWPWLGGVAVGPGAGRQPAGDLWPGTELALLPAVGSGSSFPIAGGQILACVWRGTAARCGRAALLPGSP